MTIPPALFSTEIFWSSIKWLFILIVWGVFAFGTWREDRKIRQILREDMRDRDAVTLLRTLHRRDMQIWLQVSMLLLVVAVGDIQHDAALLPADFFVTPIPVTPPVEQKDPADALYDRALKKTATANLPFSNITEFNEKNGKREAYIDWLKERYESWFVTYYYLQKCKKVAPGDYEAIHQSLIRDLNTAKADTMVEKNILMAATGSYREMYADIPCDDAHLAGTKTMYDANMQQIQVAPPGNNANPASAPATKTGTTR